MSVKPILFNTEMVRAILEGRKTQTRRIAKTATHIMSSVEKLDEKLAKDIVDEYAPFQSGDILWVRETWAKDVGRYMYRANYSDSEKFYMNGREIRMTWRPSIHMPKDAARLFLRVKDVRMERLQDMSEEDAISEGYSGICPGAHTVYFSDGYAEPCHVGGEECHYGYWYCNHSIPEAFGRDIWDGTIKPADLPRYGWEANPWVWAYEFERCEKPKGWNHG